MSKFSSNPLGPGDVANEINERLSSPVTSTKEQLVPNVDHTIVKCSCAFNGVCTLSSPNLKTDFPIQKWFHITCAIRFLSSF